MTNPKYKMYFFTFSLISSIALFSCRKKDERYEGYYTGTERNTYLDSGATVFSTDTSYMQEVDITYSKKTYTFSKVFEGAGNIHTINKKSFVDHQYTDEGGGFVKFYQDSVHWHSSQAVGWDIETWDFKGKRN